MTSEFNLLPNPKAADEDMSRLRQIVNTRATPSADTLAGLVVIGAIAADTGELIKKSDMDANNILHIPLCRKDEATNNIAAKDARIKELETDVLAYILSAEDQDKRRKVLEVELARIIAVNSAEIEKLKEQNDKFKWQVRDTCTRAEVAEAKLAKYEDQLPIGYITPKAQLSLLQDFSTSDSISPVKMGECRIAIYDSPAPVSGSLNAVTAVMAENAITDSLKAKCDRYEQTLRGIAELSATDMSYGDQVFAVTSSRSALNVEASDNKSI